MGRGYKYLLILSDLLAVMLSFYGVFWLRFYSGMFLLNAELYWSDMLIPSLIIYGYWMIFYVYNGLYHLSEAPSRTDENIKAFKAVSYGMILLFLLTFDVLHPFSIGRFLIVIYWLALLLSTTIFRSIILSVRHRQLAKGIGLTPTIVVGCNEKGAEIYEKITEYPALGYHIVGFVAQDPECKSKQFHNLPVLGYIDDISAILREYHVKQLVLSFSSSEHDKVLDVIARVQDDRVGLKILPDMYDIISGMARTQQIYGIPLIDINPQIMTSWEKTIKRITDILISSLGLLIFLPFGLILSLLIKLDSQGPVFFTQDRYGLHGKVFKMIKFRSMKYKKIHTKDELILTTKNDSRVTRVGKFIRRVRLDEVPQLINVIKGDMSLIGPRPDMPELTHQLEQKIPLYRHRLRVKPGLTGWAQITVPYPQTFEQVQKKFNCDIYYIENMSLKLDIKILFNTILTIFSASGT